MSKRQFLLYRVITALVILSVVAIAGGAGYGAAYEITIPLWFVGFAAGGISFLVALYCANILLHAVADFIASPTYRDMFWDMLRTEWHYPLIGGIPVLAAATWLWGAIWGIPIAIGVYGIGFLGYYAVVAAYVRAALGSAAFVADVYREAGVDLQKQ